MEQNEQALQWAIQYLTFHERSQIVNCNLVVKTSYSAVYKIVTTKRVVYLKKTPEKLYFESKVLSVLNEQGCRNLPELLAENSALNCYILIACGEESLRNRFNGQVDFNQLKTGILNYTNIQRQSENKIQAMLSRGIPDWRLGNFISLYNTLIQQDKLLLDDGLTEKEIEHLHQLNSTCINLSEELSQFKIPNTINHCDFHENNMLLDEETGSINIIDWSETVITHPFFSLNGCLWNITYFYKWHETDLSYINLQSECVKSWLDLYDENALLKILNIANQLNGIFAALVYERMYDATKNQASTVQQEHSGSIAGCLRTFLTPKR